MALSATGQTVAAWLFPFVVFIFANFLYMMVSWFPNHQYLLWAEARPNCTEHLPDFLLGITHAHGKTATTLTSVVDGLPGIFLLITVVVCLVMKNLRVWNRFLMTQGWMMFLKMLNEQATMIPSSYGLPRCLNYLGIKSAAEDKYAFSPTGSCVAMMWSGHVFNMMCGAYMIGLILEQRYPVLKRRTLWGSASAPMLKTVIVFVLAVFEMILLILDKGHYTVDMIVAIYVSVATFTNDNIEYLFFRINPWIRHALPEEQHPIKHGLLRDMIHELKLKGRDGSDAGAQAGTELASRNFAG